MNPDLSTMSPSTFTQEKVVYTLGELAQLTGAELVGDPLHPISGVASLEHAQGHEAAFCANSRYLHILQTTSAGVICLDRVTPPPPEKNLLLSDHPSATFQELIRAFTMTKAKSTGFDGIHTTAVIHASAQLGYGLHIGPYVVIDRDTVIGDGTCIMAHTHVGSRCRIGKECVLYPHVTIREESVLGNRVILQPGVVIGSCGFGYTQDSAGHHNKLEQIGNVVVEDDVEIGANSTIDRARFASTVIGRGTKIDNLVQIAHNVVLGQHNIVVSQTGIAGSVTTGDHVVFGGQVGVVGHIHIVSGAMIGARAGVSKSIRQAGKYSGAPALPLDEHQKQQVHCRNIPKYVEEIRQLRARVEVLETSMQK